MKTKRVVLVDYDPRWPGEFSRIRQELEGALGPLALRVEHVGSTSVPGLAAKPIIDLDVVIADETPLEAVTEALKAISYQHEGDLGIPGREAFCYEEKPHLQKHHLYVCRESSGELKRHVAFRDHLRTHPEAAAEYAAVKWEGAALFPENVDGYLAHKAPCIASIYKRCGLQ